MNTIIGIKTQQSQLFLENGTRIPVTIVRVSDMPVVQVKTKDKDGYSALQVGIGLGNQKKATKASLGHVKKANLTSFPKKLIEIKLGEGEELPANGSSLRFQDALKPGDIVAVTGTSKGKGFAGGMKRHNFKGGPRTHGQSDRARAPGSIGQTTTPGRVYKGKRMAGRMGQDKVTLQNLMVVAMQGDSLYLKGLVPGSVNSLVVIRKTGEHKSFVPPVSDKAGEAKSLELSAEGKEETKEETTTEKAAEAPVEETKVEAKVKEAGKIEEEKTPEEKENSSKEKVKEDNAKE